MRRGLWVLVLVMSTGAFWMVAGRIRAHQLPDSWRVGCVRVASQVFRSGASVSDGWKLPAEPVFADRCLPEDLLPFRLLENHVLFSVFDVDRTRGVVLFSWPSSRSAGLDAVLNEMRVSGWRESGGSQLTRTRTPGFPLRQFFRSGFHVDWIDLVFTQQRMLLVTLQKE